MAREFVPDTRHTLRSEPPDPRPGLEPDLGDHDTIAVPLASADTLPCPRLDADDLPTLRASPAELAALLRRMQPPAEQRVDLVATPRYVNRVEPRPYGRAPVGLPPNAADRTHPAHRTTAVRQADSGPTRPILRAQPWDATRPVVMRPPLRQPGSRTGGGGELIPTQLWFAPVGPAVIPARPARRGWWNRLLSLLGLATPPRSRRPAGHPGAYRQRMMRRE